MNKKIWILVLSLSLIVINLTNQKSHTQAASAQISISGPSQLAPGEQAQYNVTFTASDTAYFSYNVTSQNLTLKSKTSQAVLGSGEKKSESITLVVVAGHEGTARLNVSGTAATTGAIVSEFNVPSAQKNVTIKKSNKTVQPNIKPSSPQKSEEQLRREAEERKKAEEEAKKREEEKKKEEAQKTPLFSSFDVISKSDKRFDEILDTVPTKFDVFEYSYQLPKNIDSFRLDFEKISDDVKLEYEAEHKFSKDQTEIVVPVKAQKGEISQSFKITVKKDNTPIIKREVDGKEHTVFDDEGLDGFLEGYDFKRKTHGKGKDQVFYYEKGQLRIQLLIDDQFDGQWYLVDEKGEIIRPVTVFFLEKDLLVSFKAPEEYHSKTINEEKYEQRNMESSRRYFEIHNNLDVVQNYFSWLVEGGEIVYGMDSSGEEGFYFVSSLKDDVYQVEKAFVGFDNVDSKTQKLAMVSGFGFLGLASTNIVSYLKKRRRS